MSEPRLISPLLDGYAMGGPISSHDGVCCCPAMRENTDDKYIVKIISIPASQVQVDALLLSGAYRDQSAVLAYFKDLAESTVKEAEVLKQLSRLEGFTPYDNWQIVPKETEVGYDLYLVGSYKRSLTRYMELAPMTQLAAVNLGLDMCAALAVCRRAGCLYVDLKPENIFVFDEHTYRIGDLGFVPLSSLKYASLPAKYHSSFTAPEITDAYSALNTTIDIYALGLVLYQIYNGGSLPFEGKAPAQDFPAPMFADYEMSEIILKACAANPAQRWQNPMEMGQALVDYMQRNGVNTTPIVPQPAQPEVIPEEEPTPEDIPAEDVLAEDTPAESESVADVPAEDNAAIAAEATPVAEEVPPADEVPEAEDTPDAADAPEAEDTPVADDASEAENIPAVDDAPEAEDTPVADDAPEAEDTPVADDAPEAEDAPEEANPQSEEEDIGDLSFIDDMNVDETSPTEDSAQGLDDAVVTDEVSEILAKADELIAHETPAPVVAPDPIEVPMPERIVPKKDQDEAADASEALPEPQPEAEVPQDDGAADEAEEAPAEKPGKKHRWLIWLIVLALLAGAAYGGWYYYENYYLQTIDGFTVNYADDFIHLTVLSDLADEELIVYCSDTYGNTQKSAVTDGQASFTGLKPSTQYTLRVEPTGFHKFLGQTEVSYTTLDKTEIAGFTAKTGAEDGSAILTYTVNGTEPKSGWTITCTAEGEEPREFSSDDHWINITGLTPGKEYTFTLSAEDGTSLTGITELVYTASNVILAQDAAFVSLADGVLTATWTAPEDVVVESWSVRCYNDAGYDQTIEVTEATASFSDIDSAAGYNLDIIAAGQTQSAHASTTEHPITVISTLAEESTDSLKLQWTYEGDDPVGGWIVSYTMNGGAAQEITAESEASVTIEPLIPGCKYAFTIASADGRTVFSKTCEKEVDKAEGFNSYKIDTGDMKFNMLRRPEKENWTYKDAKDGPFTTTFTAGQKASFLVVLSHWQDKSSDSIDILYVVRDENGVPVSADTQTTVWNDMWDNGYCELDVPQIPAVKGAYTLEVYFNQKLASTTDFTVK